MNRLTQRLTTLRNNNQKALVTFITAGDPDLATTEEMIRLLEECGRGHHRTRRSVFRPHGRWADHPAFLRTSPGAGTTLTGILQTVRNVRVSSQIPIILMGYLNPIHAYGYERFCQRCRSGRC